MGNEAACTLRLEGKAFSGKAFLETTEVLFAGRHASEDPLFDD
jgi:hypothetical protein